MLFHKTFNSMADVLTELRRPNTIPKNRLHDIGFEYCDQMTFDDAFEILKRGGLYTNDVVKGLKEATFHYEESMNIGQAYTGAENDVAGYMPDIPELLAGSPIPMLNFGDEGQLGLAEKPIVRIGVNTGHACNCGAYGCTANPVHPDYCINRGAGIISLVD